MPKYHCEKLNSFILCLLSVVYLVDNRVCFEQAIFNNNSSNGNIDCQDASSKNKNELQLDFGLVQVFILRE